MYSDPRLPDSAHPGDVALRDRILDGDQRAAEAFLADHVDGLYEFVHWRVGGHRERTEDVVQDTLLVALERLESFDGRSRLSTWLYGIAKNRIRSQGRKRQPVPLEDVLASADGEIDAILEQVDREPLPDWVLERQETRELVGATLASLPEDYRRALVDKYVDGHTVPQMADAQGKGEKATESHLARARLAFARVFQLLGKKRGELA